MTLTTETSCKKQESPARVLPLQGAYNFRDLGGYRTIDNKYVKWKTVFRSGDLNHLTDKDLEYLSGIPLISTIDFRDSTEIELAPDRKPSSLKHQYFLPIHTGNVVDFRKITPELSPTLLIDGNKNFVTSNQNQYTRFFEILMNEDNAPVLYHCSAGKDRAGFAAVLFLSSLGVDRETIIEDYLLTNTYLKNKYTAMIDSIPHIAPLLEARKEYIQAAFDEIDTNYGGMNNYLVNYLKVDLEKMKALYTEEVKN